VETKTEAGIVSKKEKEKTLIMPVRPYKIFPRCFYKIFRRFDISQVRTLMMPFDRIQEVQTTGGRNAEHT